MKQIHFLLLFFALTSFLTKSYAQEKPGIVFDTLVHDFGILKKGADAECLFSFSNMDNVPVVITNVKAACGCTVPLWSREPILPGKEGTIKVKYNTRSSTGVFNKTIIVATNRNSGEIILTVKGEVTK